MYKLYPTESPIYPYRISRIDLPLKLITRTFLEVDTKLKSIALLLQGMERVLLTLDDIPVLGLLNGAAVIHTGWGVIDYRNLSGGLRDEYLSPEGLDLRQAQHGEVCLELESDCEAE